MSMTHSKIRDSFQYRKRLAAFVLGLTLFLPLYAFPFTEEHPLVYEDAWDLWPYSFLDNTGEPVGFNIDVLKLICKELDIPYRIKLKPTQDALNDLKAGRSDLMCGMDAHFHNEYAQYGTSVIQIFTHSIVHHKDEPVVIKTVDDLAKQRVIVHAGSFSHHLMIERGVCPQPSRQPDSMEYPVAEVADTQVRL